MKVCKSYSVKRDRMIFKVGGQIKTGMIQNKMKQFDALFFIMINILTGASFTLEQDN